MNESLRRKAVDKLTFLIIPAVVLLDQVTKTLAEFWFPVVCNDGVAFGVLRGGFFGEVLSLGTLILIGFLFLRGAIFKKESNYFMIAGAFILGGGLSNFVDRIIRKCVLDFISFSFWPSFNLADVAICFGVLILIWYVGIAKKNEK